MPAEAPDGDRVRAALARLLERLTAAAPDGVLPPQPFDAQWRSPCELGEPDASGLCAWRPCLRREQADFSGLERALEIVLHPSVAAYYGSYYSAHLEARTPDGGLTLIQVWNHDDFERLLANLIGHVLTQRRARAPDTFFFACTDEDEFNLCVDNASGAVVLEEPGSRPVREVAPNLAAFLDTVLPGSAE